MPTPPTPAIRTGRLCAALLACLLAACGPADTAETAGTTEAAAAGEGPAAAEDPETTAPGVTAAADGADCGEGDGMTEVDGTLARTFLCGPATATITYAGVTEKLSGGECEVSEDEFAVNFGTVVLDGVEGLDGGQDGRPDYFGFNAYPAAGDGTFTEWGAVLTRDGTFSEIRSGGQLELRDGRTSGSFGTDGLTGTFACN